MAQKQAFKAPSVDGAVARSAAAAPSLGVGRAPALAAAPHHSPARAHHLTNIPVSSAPAQLAADGAAARQPVGSSVANGTALPARLAAGIESLSGMDLSNVRVHSSSSQPAQLSALAYAQGNHIHLGPGQEHHLPHEAWHVVQQRQGRVRQTMQMRGVAVNDESGLEREADVMGQRALQHGTVQLTKNHHDPANKKYLASGVGAKQNAVSAQQRALINAQPAGTPPPSRKELKRQAKAIVG